MNKTVTAEGSVGDTDPIEVPIAGASDAIRIVRARAFSYKVPVDGPIRSNFVVVLHAKDQDGAVVEGAGEGQPRGRLTGDATEASWDFLHSLLERIYQVVLPAGNPSLALQVVRQLMKEFSEYAAEHSVNSENRRPYRGTLLGVETALLDLIAKAEGLPLCEVLGRVRSSAQIFPTPLRVGLSPRKVKAALIQQDGRYETIRVSGGNGVEQTADFLELVGLIASSRQVRQSEKPLWLEMDGKFDRNHATSLVHEIAKSMSSGRLPTRVYLEQPVPMRYADHLPILQNQADELLAQVAGGPKLTIVGDESIWDIQSFGRLKKLGGIRAVTIRPAQAGGLLASLDLAEAVSTYHPDAKITLTRMHGAGRITQSALKHLAMSLTQIDGVSLNMFKHSLLPFARRASGAQGVSIHEDDSLVEQEEQEEPPQHGPASIVDSAEQADFAEESTPSDDDSDEREEDDPFAQGNGLTGPEAGDNQSVALAVDTATVKISTLRTTSPKGDPGLGLTVRFAPLVSEARRFATIPEIPEPKNEGKLPTRYDHVEDVRPLGPNGTKGYLLEKRALARGLSTTRYSKSAFVAFDGDKPSVNFKWSRNPVSSAVAISVCTHKETTRLMLEGAGVPTPQGRTFRNGDFGNAKAFVELIGYPVVVKPSMGIRGIGVIAGIEDKQQLSNAFELMADSKFGGQDFIVEKHIRGRDHRILVVGGEVVAAIQRKPASVLGDGISTVAEQLIHRNVARRSNPHLWTRPARFDGTMAHQLAKLGLTLDTVVPAGEEVMLSNTANISQGADSIDVFDTLHPSIVETCKKAVAAVPGMQYCGVDFLLEDPSRAVEEQDAAIIELNAHAAIGNCEYPMFGTSRQVAQKLMDLTIDQKNLRATDPQEELTVHLTIRGKVTRVGFRKWLQRHALKMGAIGWVRNLNRRTVEAVVQGPTERIAPLIASCIIGPPNALPTSYNATVIPSVEAELRPEIDFEIRARPSPGDLPASEHHEVQQLADADQEHE